MIRILILLLGVFSAGCVSHGSGDWPLVAEVDRSSGSISSPNSPDTILVATYNLHGLIHRDRIRADIAGLNADVWLFQEVQLKREASAPEEIRRLLPAGEWDICVVRVNPSGQGIGSVEAQAIASRFPIRKAEVWPATAKTVRRRCLAAAWIDVGDKDALVINVDHEPGFFSASDVQHHLQNDLISRMKELGNAPVVVGGDFNTGGNFWRNRSGRREVLQTHDAMRQVGFISAMKPGYDTFNAWPWDFSLDHLFARGVVMSDAGVMDSAQGSDHWPVWCRLKLNGSPAS